MVTRAALLLVAALSGCSLMLEELDITCSPQSDDCDALNAKHRLTDADCFVYQCRQDRKGCQKMARDWDEDQSPDATTCSTAGLKVPLDCDDSNRDTQPGLAELCDGTDNDCDGQIDEGALNATTLPGPDRLAAEAVVGLSYSEREDVPLVALTSRVGSAPYSTSLRLPEQLRSELAATQGKNCDFSSIPRYCQLSEMAIASHGELLLAVAINVSGCAAGQLRVGRKQLGSSGPLTWDGLPLASSLDLRSNLAQGVDTVNGCSRSLDREGASAPSVALASGAYQALATWRAGRAGTAAPLVALGLLLYGEQTVQGGADGHAEPLDADARLGHDAASIHFWGSPNQPGYVIGYDSEYGVELTFTPLAGTGSALGGLSRLTLPASSVRQVVLSPQSSVANNGAQTDELATAWREESEGQQTIHFQKLSLSGTAPEFTVIGETQILRSRPDITAGPVMAYAATGFGSGQRFAGRGGWLIAWVEGSEAGAQTLVGARVDDQARQLGEPFVLLEDRVLHHPFVFRSNDAAVGYGVVSGQPEKKLNIGSLSCK